MKNTSKRAQRPSLFEAMPSVSILRDRGAKNTSKRAQRPSLFEAMPSVSILRDRGAKNTSKRAQRPNLLEAMPSVSILREASFAERRQFATKGKKYFMAILAILMLATASGVQAQGIFDRLKKSVKESTTKTDTSDTANKNATTKSLVGNLTSSEISSGLKEALNMGIEEGIKKLGKEDGFFKNEIVKILLPEKLQKVEKTLRSIGLGSLADQGIKLMNRAAEDAVTEGAPIFANAITSMSFDDAKTILLGDNNAATTYLKTKTSARLSEAFEPKVENSLGKVGADKVWEQIISRYNSITGENITVNLNEYVTEETINGVFKMVAEKEEGIRENSALRTTSLLKEVFGAQD